jgi:putative tryptophan/tyrosine transport system substrate-binding protein
MQFDQLRRREFLTLLGGAAAAWPLAALAQQPERVRRIGVLMVIAANDPEAQTRAKAFEQALHQLGWADGSRLRIEYRWAGGDAGRIRSQAAEIVSLTPDVILANATPALEAVRQETRTIPIVFVQVIDPVSRGFVDNLARPGGNITGFTNFEFPMGGKWVEMLKEIAPSITSVAVIFNPDTAPYGEPFFQHIGASASSRSIEAIEARVRSAVELEKAVAGIAAKSNSGLIVLPDTFTTVHRDSIIELANRHRLPGVYPFRYFADRGGLISYGVDAVDLFRRSASYVDRILKGEKPANLPVQAPVKYELVLNVKTAKTLGIDIPPTLLARADEVIE